MLQQLTIQNYAIIDEIDIQFSPKLNIITGETGAGKSIIMGALGLILGERAESNVIRNPQKKCFVEGIFKPGNHPQLKALIHQLDIDWEDEFILRREISSTGKSRAFINDAVVNLQQLKQVASLLVDLHQQFDTLEINNNDFQLAVVDAIANHSALLQSYKISFSEWKKHSEILQSLIQQKESFAKEHDYNSFLFEELASMQFKENELEEIEGKLKLMSNAEAIKSTLLAVVDGLETGEQPLIQQLKQMIQKLNAYSNVHESISPACERLKNAYTELQDISNDLEHINRQIHFDEEAIETMNERMAAGYKLLKKHGVQTTAQLLQIQQQLEEKLQSVLMTETSIQEAEKQTQAALVVVKELAQQLTAGRQKAIPILQDKVNVLLKKVGMPNAALQIAMNKASFSMDGADEVGFLFDANKSGKFEPVSKVASGGELSRLMLCIKSLIAETVELSTMIFDEIDTGISGEAAKQVANIMQQMASLRQIICITHQPQIAGKADSHLYIYKNIEGDHIKTNVKLLSAEERIIAIARMISGEQPTTAAIENAKELMN